MEEQHLDRQPPTVVMQATTWWGTVLAHVKEYGLGVNLHVRVRCYSLMWEEELSSVHPCVEIRRDTPYSS